MASVNVSAGGSGYAAAGPPNVVFSGGGGSGAAATANINSGGAITGVTITNPGSGYTAAPTVSFVGGGGSGATATAAVTSFFQDTSGEALHGNGVSGDNYLTSFTYTTAGGVAAGTVSVSLPQFARGPEKASSPANLNLPNNSSNLLPIVLSNGNGVTRVDLFVQYNPSDLDISGVTTTLAGASFAKVGAATTNGDGTVTQEFLFTSPPLASGVVTLGGLTATVPFSSAIYQQKNLLHVAGLTVTTSTTIPSVGVDGLQLVAYLGDTDGNGQYSGNDTQLLARVLANLDTGFSAFRLIDPALLVDVNGDNKVNSTDATQLNRFIDNTNGGSTLFPVPPVGLTFPTPGPDPSLSIPSDLQVGAEGTVTVPVILDDPKPAGSTGMTQALLALTYDPAVFSVSPADVHLGTVPAAGSGWTVTTIVNATPGQLAIDLHSLTPIGDGTGGSLVIIDFHLTGTAPAGALPIHLAATVDPTGTHEFRTEIDDAQGAFTLSPAPTNAVNGGTVLLSGPNQRTAPAVVSPGSGGTVAGVEQTTLAAQGHNVSGILNSMETTTQEPRRTVDVTGLPEEAVRALEALVTTLRQQGTPSTAYSTYVEWSKAFAEWVASHQRVANPADWSRDSIYAGRGE